MVDFLLLALFLVPTAFAAFLPLVAPLLLFFAADFLAAFLAGAFLAGAFLAAGVGAGGAGATALVAGGLTTVFFAAAFLAGAFAGGCTGGALTGGGSGSMPVRVEETDDAHFLFLFVIVVEGIFYIFRKLVRLGFKLTVIVCVELVFVLHSFASRASVASESAQRTAMHHTCLRRGL